MYVEQPTSREAWAVELDRAALPHASCVTVRCTHAVVVQHTIDSMSRTSTQAQAGQECLDLCNGTITMEEDSLGVLWAASHLPLHCILEDLFQVSPAPSALVCGVCNNLKSSDCCA